MRRLIILIALVAAAYYSYTRQKDSLSPEDEQSIGLQQATATGEDAIARAFENRQSNVQVQSSGTVDKVLSDDNEGSRHQRFIVKLRSGHTVLIAHNIDLAARVPLKVGDEIQFSGEYEWNNKGGVVHWTHRDPSGRHVAGWIRCAGQTYQ